MGIAIKYSHDTCALHRCQQFYSYSHKTSMENENANSRIKGVQCPNLEELPHISANLDKIA